MRINPTMFEALQFLLEHNELTASQMGRFQDRDGNPFRYAAKRLLKLGLIVDRREIALDGPFVGKAVRLYSLTEAGRTAAHLAQQLEAVIDSAKVRPVKKRIS